MGLDEAECAGVGLMGYVQSSEFPVQGVEDACLRRSTPPTHQSNDQDQV